jgi:hypothetical protein
MYLTPEGEAIFLSLKCVAYIEIMRSYHEARKYAKINEILDQIPQMRDFWEAYVKLSPDRRDSVFQRLLILHRDHLETVKRRTDALADEKDMRTTKIIAMAPGNWDAAMTQRYADRLLGVWRSSGLSKDDIHIIGECDALAHWLVSQKPEIWLLNEKHRNFLIADFGGHTLVRADTPKMQLIMSSFCRASSANRPLKNIYRFCIYFNNDNNSFCYFALGNGYTSKYHSFLYSHSLN